MSAHKIIFVSQEIAPYLSVNNGKYGRDLPQAIQSRKYEVRTFMPDFGEVNERRNQLHEVIRLSGVNIVIDDNDHPLIIKVASLQPSRIQVYFIDNDDFFLKDNDDVDATGSNRPDNDERIIFYTRGTLETAKKLRWEPRIIHLSGWFTSLIPMYLKRGYSDDLSFKGSKVVYTVTPAKLSAPLDERIFNKLKDDNIPAKDLKKYADLNLDTDLLHRMAIDFSHAVIVEDPEVSPELLEYIRQSGKPFITADKLEEGPEAYAEFFNSL